MTNTTRNNQNRRLHATSSSSMKQGITRFVNAVAKRPRTLFPSSGPALSSPSTSSLSSKSSVSSTKTETTKEMKSVEFADNVAIRSVPTRHEYTPEEKRACWFSEEEYSQISQSCLKQIRRMELGEAFKGKKYCGRGLEQHMRIGSTIRKRNRSEAVAVVLDEKERQNRAGLCNDESIARLYKGISSSSQLWANLMGKRDQRAAEELYTDDDEIQFALPPPEVATTTRTTTRPIFKRFLNSRKSPLVIPEEGSILIVARSA